MTKTKIKYFFSLVFLILIFTFQKTNFISIQTTINLFFKSVMPSLFLFILFTNVILAIDIKKPLKKIFKSNYILVYIALIGFFCGYPMGTKAASKYYDEKAINIKNIKYLMSFANNANPIYIISTIGIATLENFKLGLILALSHYLSSLTICTCYLFYKDIIHEKSTNLKSKDNISDKKLHKSLFEILNDSIKATYHTLSQILAYIIIFNVISQEITIVLKMINIPQNIIYIIQGLLESTKGISIIALNYNASQTITISIISFILGFSGLSIIFQIYSCIYNTKINIFHIIKYKLLQGSISFVITYILLNIKTINITDVSLTIRTQKLLNNTSTFLIITSLLFLFAANIKKVTRKI